MLGGLAAKGVLQAMATHRPPQHVGRWTRRLLVGIPPVLAAVLIVVVIVLFLDDRAEELAMDADLCPIDNADISHHAMFLLDLRKPLGENRRTLLAESLRSVTMALDANAELRVFTLADTDAAPRRQVARLCKPYDNAQLTFEGAKDSSQANRDCDDLPAQVPSLVRDRAQQFCARRAALQSELEQLAAVPVDGLVENAYLIEALEETSLRLTSASRPISLYLLSDMLQHAAWYSHLEIDWSGWTFDEFIQRRSEQDALVGPRPAAMRSAGVTVFYVPREEITDQIRTKMAHQRFWQRYFTEAFLTKTVFVEEAPQSAYAVAPLMEVITEADLIAAELARLQQEREEAERLLEQVEEQRAAFENARRAAEEEAQEVLAAARLAQEEALAAAQLAQEEAQRRLEAQRLAEEEAQRRLEAELLAEEEARRARDAALLAEDQGQTTEGDGDGETDDPAALAADGTGAGVSTELPAPAQPPPSAAPAQLAQDPPDPLPVSASAGEDALAECPIELKPRFQGRTEFPPSVRWIYASATIAVRFVVDDNGNTIDNSITILEEGSTADPPSYLDRFGDHVRNIASTWEFVFQDAGVPCARRQEVTTAIDFTSRSRPPTVPVR